MSVPPINVAPATGKTFTHRLLGADFIWHHADRDFMDRCRQEVSPLVDAILSASEQIRLRQKRDYVTYQDVMYCIDRGLVFPVSYFEKGESALAMELTVMLRDKRLDPRPVLELDRLGWRSSVSSRFDDDPRVWAVPGHRGVSPKRSPSRGLLSSDDPRANRAPVPRRWLIDMGGAIVPDKRLDWHGMAIRALLVRLRAVIEIYLETGYYQIACCQRVKCRGYFESKRMSGRQKFCSTYCRVAASRES